MRRKDAVRADVLSRFHESFDELNQALLIYGLPAKPLIDRSFSGLSEISAERAEEILKTIRSFERLIRAGGAGDRELLKTPALIEAAFRGLKLSYAKDFVDGLKPTDVVDGYSVDNLQIFRNFRFMEICGYSLQDLMLMPWMDLFERPNIITKAILERIEEVLRTGRTVSLEDIPAHYMRERLSGDRQIVRVKFHNLGAVFESPGKPAGFLASSTAEFVNEKPERDELRFI